MFVVHVKGMLFGERSVRRVYFGVPVLKFDTASRLCIAVYVNPGHIPRWSWSETNAGLLERLLHQTRPVFDGGGQVATMDIVERMFFISPVFLEIIDNKLQVRRIEVG
jgi:hypothetical protein